MELKLQSCKAITADKKHNAFTDLIFYDNQFWCAYRQASSHMLLDGVLVILTSKNAKDWNQYQILSWAGGDLRDPKFVINSQNQLWLMSGLRMACFNNYERRIASIDWQLHDDGFVFAHGQLGTWRWSGTLFDNQVLSVGYSGRDTKGVLYTSQKSTDWKPLVSAFFPKSDCFTNESSLVFNKKEQIAYALVRRDGENCPAMLGKSQRPFMQWDWTALDLRVGGPKLIQLDKGNLIAGFRLFTEESVSMVLAEIDIENGCFFNIIELPSDGDCSYPGLLIKNNLIYVTYYSSHDNGCQIYCAELSYS